MAERVKYRTESVTVSPDDPHHIIFTGRSEAGESIDFVAALGPEQILELMERPPLYFEVDFEDDPT